MKLWIGKTEWYPVLTIEPEPSPNSREVEIPGALQERWRLAEIEFDAVQEELGKLYWTDEERAE